MYPTAVLKSNAYAENDANALKYRRNSAVLPLYRDPEYPPCQESRAADYSTATM